MAATAQGLLKTTLTGVLITTAVPPGCSGYTGLGVVLVGAADLPISLAVGVRETGRLVGVHLVFIRAATEANCWRSKNKYCEICDKSENINFKLFISDHGL